MKNLVFIIGAGASKHAGVPLMDNFLDKSRELYFMEKNSGYKEDFEKILQAVNLLKISYTYGN